MNYTVNNWMVLTINSDKGLVVDNRLFIIKKFFSSEKEATEYMADKTKTYAKAKEISVSKHSAFVDCGEYFIQMQVINCSKDIQIIG